jgi:Tfp pilus assembly PilM family ATPase
MPRILAIDWDRREARALLITSGATGMSVSGAWTASLVTAEGAGLEGKQIGARLAVAMSGAVSGKVTTLVGVGRDNVQMQLLSLPPAPESELPEMVRFQADREFTTLGSEAALDFIPLTGDAQTPHQVLAVALSAAGMAEARDVCEPLGVELNRIPLRAAAAGALVYRARVVADDKVALIVNPFIDEADLTVQAGDKVVLMRTVRLPDSSQEGRQRALLGEIRRTLAAVRQQLADGKVDHVVVCGSASDSEQDTGLSDELEVPVTYLDPTTQAPSGLASQGVAADGLARFAAVLGMALTEADRRPPVVDFANVRRTAEGRRIGRVHALAAAAAVIGILAVVANLWRQASAPAKQLAEIEAAIAAMQPQAEPFEAITARAAAIEGWQATDVNWLDEIEQLARRIRPEPFSSKEFPVNDDVVVTQLNLSRAGGADAVGGHVDLQIKAKSDSAIRDLEQRLRASGQKVVPGGVQRDSTVPGYPRSTSVQLQVVPSEEDEPAATSVEATP